MPRKNNEVAGTLHCADCGETATIHCTKRGGRSTTQLYKRCACGCDQRNGAHIQKKWREEMEPRPGWEWVKTGVEPVPPPEPESKEFNPNEPAKAEPVEPAKPVNRLRKAAQKTFGG